MAVHPWPLLTCIPQAPPYPSQLRSAPKGLGGTHPGIVTAPSGVQPARSTSGCWRMTRAWVRPWGFLQQLTARRGLLPSGPLSPLSVSPGRHGQGQLCGFCVPASGLPAVICLPPSFSEQPWAWRWGLLCGPSASGGGTAPWLQDPQGLSPGLAVMPSLQYVLPPVPPTHPSHSTERPLSPTLLVSRQSR